MEYGFGTEGYYKKMLELQERLRKSEEERLKLEEKFNEMMQVTRDVEHDRLRLMRHRYHKFLEDDKNRQERNENILRILDGIESRANMLAAKTCRFKAFRKQYDSYIKRVYRTKTEQQPLFPNTTPSQPDISYTHSNVRKKLFSDLPRNEESVEGKLAMLEQYLRDNFDNFPREPAAKSPNNNYNANRVFNENGHNANIAQHQRNSFYNPNNFERQHYFEPVDSDSKESQEINDDYNKYPVRQFDDKESPKQTYSLHGETKKSMSPTKGELLGNSIEKELERLKNKEPIKQISIQKDNSFEIKEPEKVIQDYKDLVSKSEEKYGLRGESPVRSSKNNEEKKELSKEYINNPSIYDNATKTVNINELKNIAITNDNTDNRAEKDISQSNNILQENVDSESENPVIKNYKNMLKSLQDDTAPPPENNVNVNEEEKNLGKNLQENLSEHSKQEDNSARTEAPSDISLNFSSHQSEEPLPIDQIEEKQNETHVEDPTNTFIQNDQIMENSAGEATIKEQVHINPEKEELEISKQLEETDNTQNINQPQDINTPKFQTQEILGEQIYHEFPHETDQDNQQPVYEDQNYQEETVETQPQQEENTTQQQQDQQPEYQEGYDTIQQNEPVYQEGYENSQQNVTDNQGYDMTQQPEYQEGINQQQEYSEGYDTTQQNITDPNYQEGYDAQYYAQQSEVTQEGYDNQQYAEGQPEYPEGYEQQYPTEQYPEQQQEGYDPQQYPTDQGQYQEYPEQEYQPQEYPQQYDDQQYPQEGQVSENVYQSGQEYLQGEQNIDKQYESEQNPEHQSQEYPENYAEQEQAQEQSEEIRNSEQHNVNVSDSTGKSSSPNEFIDNKPIIEKTLPNLADMLDTDTESIKQDTKVSNDSDFDLSKS